MQSSYLSFIKPPSMLMLVICTGIVYLSCNTKTNTNNPAVTDSSKQNNVTERNPLPGWTDGPLKDSIISFVTNAVKENGANYISPDDRIAVFDNDGTLWAEQPLYFQFFFSIDRIKQMAPQHPEWKNKEPFASALAGNVKAIAVSGVKAYVPLMDASFSGMPGAAFSEEAKTWIDSAKHPVTKKLFKTMIYQPMLELMSYLRAHGFQTFIVSGGDMDFMRAWVEKTYDIPSPQVVGSSLKVAYEVKNDTPYIMRLPDLNFMNDGPGKPVGIYQHIGKKPVFAAGNSDGDYQMLQWTASNMLPHMEIIVHHTDAVREWAYDSTSYIGRLSKGLADAKKYGWMIVDMKNDWKTVFPGN